MTIILYAMVLQLSKLATVDENFDTDEQDEIIPQCFAI